MLLQSVASFKYRVSCFIVSADGCTTNTSRGQLKLSASTGIPSIERSGCAEKEHDRGGSHRGTVRETFPC
jgi:hypothetical protein